jgi:hypothetical protein
VFIRGDDALGYAGKVKFLLSLLEGRAQQLSQAEITAWARVQELSDLLESCRVPSKSEPLHRA